MASANVSVKWKSEKSSNTARYRTHKVFSVLADIIPLGTRKAVLSFHDHSHHYQLLAMPKRRPADQPTSNTLQRYVVSTHHNIVNLYSHVLSHFRHFSLTSAAVMTNPRPITTKVNNNNYEQGNQNNPV